MHKKIVIVLYLLLISTSSMSSNTQINSTFKPFPKPFIGKWAGLHSTHKELDKIVLDDLCEHGGDADTSYFIEFNQEDSSIMTLVWWTNLSTEYPISYDNYTASYISGRSSSNQFELVESNKRKTDSFSEFEYRIVNNKLYTGFDDEVIELMRCDENIEPQKL